MDYHGQGNRYQSIHEDLNSTYARELTNTYFNIFDHVEWSLLGFLSWFQTKHRVDDGCQQLLHSVFKNKCRDIASSSLYTDKVKNVARSLYGSKSVCIGFLV